MRNRPLVNVRLGLASLVVAAPLGAQGTPVPEGAPKPTHLVRVEWSHFAPMRDGVKLSADWYFPADLSGRLPTILIRTPYNKKTFRLDRGAATWFAGHGYAVVVQDVRGKYESDGVFTTSANDRNDGYDTMAWIAAQPWTTGKVGTYGCSYQGEDQVQLAAMRHPAHAAAIPQAAGIKRHPKRTLSNMLPIATITEKAGSAPNDWKDFVTHPPEDPFWKRFGSIEPSDSFDVPALHVNSWYDPAVGWTAVLFNQMRTNGGSAGRDHQYLLISPTPHCGSERGSAEKTTIGERNLGDTRFDWFGTYLKWFDQYYAMGRNRWQSAATFPFAEPTPFYFHSDGRANSRFGSGTLSVVQPRTEPADRYLYDPGSPVPSKAGPICCTGSNERTAPRSTSRRALSEPAIATDTGIRS